MPDFLLTEEEVKKIREAILAEKRKNDPNYGKRPSPASYRDIVRKTWKRETKVLSNEW